MALGPAIYSEIRHLGVAYQRAGVSSGMATDLTKEK